MLLTKVITEKEIRSNIEKGAYLDIPVATSGFNVCFSENTLNMFQKDIVEFLIVVYKFNLEQSNVIFNRCWLDCSGSPLVSILEEVIDTADFTTEMFDLLK